MGFSISTNDSHAHVNVATRTTSVCVVVSGPSALLRSMLANTMRGQCHRYSE
jgi:hypothetical protein